MITIPVFVVVLFVVLALATGYTLALRRAPTERPAPGCRCQDAAAIALNDACCERWWTSAGTDHEPTCPRNETRP
ncbi:hypothetical protein [Streptomyces sp. HGB0020]|uniref:hypothetical protein n=1 Tax=Streptomyces sp. HGB0020 TaxID=1078086 RepID=UPI00034E916F|nr:hypothetical protein [Streptomyces sp. HGB0020]EPD63157.1 hypothetical protein HMPREF1211_03498 [Streptomyces sp. HGB0020]